MLKGSNPNPHSHIYMDAKWKLEKETLNQNQMTVDLKLFPIEDGVKCCSINIYHYTLGTKINKRERRCQIKLYLNPCQI